MIKKKIEFFDNKLNGGQNILPSAFPFYSKNEIEEFFTLEGSQIAKRIAIDLELEVDGDGGDTVCLDENLYIADLTNGGEISPKFATGVSPSVISAVISALGEMDLNGEKTVLSVLLDEGIISSCFFAMLMGFPIKGIVAPFCEERSGKLICLVDVTEDDIVEYIGEFYDDFDFLLGVNDARACLCADIFTNGFEEKTLIVSGFGYAETPSVCCLALSGKKKSDKDALKWIDLNCALPILDGENSRKVSDSDKKTMKELCNILNGAKVH